jgi:CheY-like chemotaxis protein
MAQVCKCCETVLIVEDEGLVRLDAAESLREAGFAVLEATDAAEALEIVLSGEEFDVLFTDINMPGEMDGIELARRVHDCRPAVRLVLTSGAIKPTRDQLPDDGAFIAKPYSPETVTRAVKGMRSSYPNPGPPTRRAG